MVDGQPEWIISFRALSSGSDAVCSLIISLPNTVTELGEDVVHLDIHPRDGFFFFW